MLEHAGEIVLGALFLILVVPGVIRSHINARRDRRIMEQEGDRDPQHN